MAITNNEFYKLSGYIKENIGINLTEKKKSLLNSRLNKVLTDKNFDNMTEYYNYVVTDKSGKALTELIDHITTNHTYFYREKQHYAFLMSDVLPYLTEKKQHNKDLRIWSAGCSSGEEPYSLAMVLADYFGNQKILWDTKILATDISTIVLEKAKKAVYSKESIKNNPITWNNKYYHAINNESYQLNDTIRKEVIFRRLNLISEFNFKQRFDIIFCRNVMIYFDVETREKIIEKFYNIIEPGGYLFISHSESLDRNRTKFKYVRPSIYRRED